MNRRTDHTPPPHGHIAALDGLRGIAIALVLAFHLFDWDRPGVAGLDAVYRVLSCGWVGVDLFFVLSGFLITGILLRARDRPAYFRNFYARRAVRIFPLYYSLLLVGSVVTMTHRGTAGVAGFATYQPWLWTYLTNLPVAARNDFLSMDAGPFRFDLFWSLAVEEHFYLVWPVVVRLCPGRWLVTAAVSAVVALAAARTFYVHSTGRTITAYVFTPLRVDGLLLGAACAVLVRREAVVRWVRRSTALLLGGAGAILTGGYLATGWRLESRIVAGPGFTLLAVAFAGLILVAVVARPGHLVRRVAEWRPLRFFGKYSYGIYAWHMTLLAVVLAPTARRLLPVVRSNTVAGLGAKGVTVLACLGTAYLSWHLFEKHFLRLKRFFEYPGLPLPAGEKP